MLNKLWAPMVDRPQSRRGVWRMQADQVQREEAGMRMSSISRLGGGQLLLWADGELSAQQLQATMQDSVADGLRHPMALRLGRLQSGQHAHQGIMSLLRESTAVLDDVCEVAGGSGDQILKPSCIIRRLFLSTLR